jgi:hypothetical protein
MRINVKHVLLNETDINEIADAVSADKEPRILERDGKAVAALVSIEDLNRIVLAGPTSEGIQQALGAIGAWRDMDTDELRERIYQWRHESPPRPPVIF